MSERTGAEERSGVFGPERRSLTIGILLAVGAFAVEGMGVVPALPLAVRELGGLPWFGWAFSAFMLAWLVGTVGAGVLADARGPRVAMALGLAGFASGLVLAGAAQGMARFLAGRALQGAGGGAMIAAAYVVITRGYPDQQRARMMALTASVWVLPAIVGPTLSGAVAQWLGWRYVFIGIVPLLALAALMVLPPLGRFELRRSLRGGSRVVSALCAAAGGGLLLASPSLVERRAGPILAVGGALMGAALLVPALRRLLPLGTLRARPGLPAGLVARGLVAFSFFGAEAFVPLGAGQLRGASPIAAGLALTAGSFGWISATWVQDRMEAGGDAAGRAGRVGVGFLLLAVGVSLVSLGLLTGAPLLVVPLGWAVAGAGIGLAFSAGGLICLAAAPEGQEGEVSAQLQLIESLGTAAGTGLGGALLAMLVRLGRPPKEAYAFLFSMTLAAALAGLLLARRLARP